MAGEAKVTSLDALDRFRAQLIVFMTKARRCIDEAKDELRQTRLWLQQEQRTHWENQIRTRQRKLDQAKAELFNAKLSKFTDSVARQKAMVRKAQDAMDEATEKLRYTKKWSQNFESVVDPHAKGFEGLDQYLEFDLPKAIAHLVQIQRTLEQYAERAPSKAAPKPAEEPSHEQP